MRPSVALVVATLGKAIQAALGTPKAWSDHAVSDAERRGDLGAQGGQAAAARLPGARPRRRSVTGSTTSRYALSFGSVPEGRITTRAAAVRRISTSVAGQQVLDRGDRRTEQRRRRLPRGPGPSPRPISARSSTRTESWSVRCTPNSAASSSSRSPRVRPSALSAGGQLGDGQRGGDAVLVPDQAGRHAVAERLLVAERQLLGGPDDPLEAGQRLRVRHAAGRAERPSRLRRDDRGGVGARRRRAGSGGRRAARPARRRAAAASRRPGRGSPPRSGRRPGRWRWPGRRRSRAASASSRSIAPGSSGLGNATVGKSGSGSACSATTAGAAKPAAANAAASDLAAHPVQRGVRDPQVARTGRATTAAALSDVPVDDLSRRGACRARPAGPRRAARPPGSRPRCRRRRAARSARRRRPAHRAGRPDRPCSRCPAAGCGWR